MHTCVEQLLVYGGFEYKYGLHQYWHQAQQYLVPL